MRPTTPLESALLVEVASKSDLIWVRTDEGQSALWHVWVDEQIAVVVGGGEQPDPGFRDHGQVVVTVRSKDKGQRLLSVLATSTLLAPDSPQWQTASQALVPKRLNASVTSDGTPLPNQWAKSSGVWSLAPTGDVLEGPGDYDLSDHRAEPVSTGATTVTHHPFHLGKATKKRRR